MQFNTDVMVKDENIKIPLEKKKLEDRGQRAKKFKYQKHLKN